MRKRLYIDNTGKLVGKWYDKETNRYIATMGKTKKYYSFKEITPLYYPEYLTTNAICAGWKQI